MLTKEKQKLPQYIKQWGGPSSITLLDPNCKIFTDPSIEGAIGYSLKNNNIVVYGDPICSPENSSKLARAFYDFSKENHSDIIYLGVSEEFSRWAMSNGFQSLIEVEEELVIDPALYPKKGENGHQLRKKLNRSSREHVEIKEYTDKNPETKKKIVEAEDLWLKGRKGPQIYMSHINFFDDAKGTRCFYAEKEGQIVGTLYLIRLDAHNGWLLHLLTTIPHAPVGTSESLVISTLDQLAKENCHFFSFGISAVEKIGDAVGLSKISTWIANAGFKVAKKFFSLDSRRNFWKKFEPHNKRSFTLFTGSSIGIKEVLAILKTVNASLYNK